MTFFVHVNKVVGHIRLHPVDVLTPLPQPFRDQEQNRLAISGAVLITPE